MAKPVAPWRHTAILIAIFLLLSAAGFVFERDAPRAPQASRAPLYLSLAAIQGALLYYVWKGLRRGGTRLRELIGGRWAGAKDIVADAILAAGLWTAWALVAATWSHLSGPPQSASIQPLLPHGALDATLWVALSAAAGFTEEIVFRGYFQRQFEAWTGSRPFALLLQGALFGIGHGYQGMEACLRIAAYGILFGLVALWRRSLRPGMLAHGATDILAGIFGI